MRRPNYFALVKKTPVVFSTKGGTEQGHVKKGRKVCTRSSFDQEHMIQVLQMRVSLGHG